jgi:hypothetical protein
VAGNAAHRITQPAYGGSALSLTINPSVVHVDRLPQDNGHFRLITASINASINGVAINSRANLQIITPLPEWLTRNILDHQQLGILPLSPNQTPYPRSHTIQIRLTNPAPPHQTVDAFVEVIQPGIGSILLELEPSDTSFGATGGTQEFTVRAIEDGGTPRNAILSPGDVSVLQGGEIIGLTAVARSDGLLLVTVPPQAPEAIEQRVSEISVTYMGTTQEFPITQFGNIVIGPGSPDGGDGEVIEVTCDLGPLGWALCPVITGLNDMLGSIYHWVESEFLQVQLEFYATDSGTYTAWAIFRNIANVLFVIFFLVVIFSQVTSIGINNYGIKKMLPEIITAAILINLSFFICQAMVDMSNILGSQIKGLLDGIANTIAGVHPAPPESAGGLAIFLTVLGVVAAGAVVITIATVLLGGLGALFAGILLFLLAAVISMLMLFTMLMIRQMGVIIFVAISPLAFAARILPNTAGLFKSWWKMFTVLLLIYPICGLVLGAGRLAGTIIASSSNGNVIIIIGALVAMIAPYFFVITLIKGSLAGLGRLGSMITGKVTGAGTGINRMGARGINAGGKKLGQITGHTAARNAKVSAKAAIAKAKAEEKSAKLAASGKGVYGKTAEAQFRAGQTADNAEMASLGQYTGNDASLQKTSRANAIRLGLYKAGNAAYDADLQKAGGTATVKMSADTAKSNINATKIKPDSYEAQQQAQSKTALQQTQKKEGEKIDAEYAEMGLNQVFGEVMDGNNLAAGASPIRVERAVKKMLDKGEWSKAQQITDAYMRSGRLDLAGQRRLGDVFTKTPDVKDQAFQFHALGKQFTDNAEDPTSAVNFNDTNGYFNSDQFKSKVEGGKYDKQIATAHGESAEMLATADAAADSNALRTALGRQISGQAAGNISDSTMRKYVGSDGLMTGGTMFARAAGDYTAAGNNAANWGYSNDKKTFIGASGVTPSPVPAIPQERDTNPPAINFQRTENSSFTDTATGVRHEETNTVDLSGQEVMSQIARSYTPEVNEIAGSRQYYQNAVDRLSSDQLGQIIQRDNLVNAGGNITDRHFNQLRSFAERSLARRGETIEARLAQMARVPRNPLPPNN